MMNWFQPNNIARLTETSRFARIKRQEREKEMLKKFSDARARIWGNEAHACNIIIQDIFAGAYYADCEATMVTRRLTDSNYEEVLNDMFYDYCVENASYMGVS
jgi:hypothetical protein